LPCVFSLGITSCGSAAPAPAPTPERLPSYDECRTQYGHGCYTPTQIRVAYGLDRLHAQGLDGRGTTIAIVIPGANPYAQEVLDRFSDEAGLPRTRIEVINRGGKVPAPGDVAGNLAALEAVTDLQIAHLAAPAAKLIYLQTGSAQLSGIGNAMRAIDWLVRNRRVDAISMSWGASEPSVLQLAGGRAGFDRMRGALITADQRRTTLLAATGDYGSGGHDLTDPSQGRTVAWPASDPLVTAVGGIRLHLDDQGRRIRPDEVWGSASLLTQERRGTGAGTSTLFPRPAHQDHAATLLGSHRGVPDLVANASAHSSVWVHTTERGRPAVVPAHGTSIAAPLVAGIVALANQQADRPLGNIGPALHHYAHHPEAAGLTDLTSGCNHTAPRQGYCAAAGYDRVSGLGALTDAPLLVQALTSYEGSKP